MHRRARAAGTASRPPPGRARRDRRGSRHASPRRKSPAPDARPSGRALPATAPPATLRRRTRSNRRTDHVRRVLRASPRGGCEHRPRAGATSARGSARSTASRLRDDPSHTAPRPPSARDCCCRSSVRSHTGQGFRGRRPKTHSLERASHLPHPGFAMWRPNHAFPATRPTPPMRQACSANPPPILILQVGNRPGPLPAPRVFSQNRTLERRRRRQRYLPGPQARFRNAGPYHDNAYLSMMSLQQPRRNRLRCC